MEALTWTSSLQVEYNNWPRNLKVQKPLHETYKASLRGAPGYPDQPAVTSEDCSYLKTDTNRKDFKQNLGWVTTSHMDMSNTKVKYCIREQRGPQTTNFKQTSTFKQLQ